jgi:hypothetical protein
MLAREIAVGDTVEFEIGVPVQVIAIEPSWSTQDPDPHPWLLQHYGRSLVFYSVYQEEYEDKVHTAYIRREMSPVSGNVIR